MLTATTNTMKRTVKTILVASMVASILGNAATVAAMTGSIPGNFKFSYTLTNWSDQDQLTHSAAEQSVSISKLMANAATPVNEHHSERAAHLPKEKPPVPGAR